jgi:hypothetical protein
MWSHTEKSTSPGGIQYSNFSAEYREFEPPCVDAHRNTIEGGTLGEGTTVDVDAQQQDDEGRRPVYQHQR